MATTTPTLAEELTAARAETARLQQLQDKIDKAGAEARNEAMLAHYMHAATERAREHRERRDQLKNRVDELATADKLDLNVLFKAWLEMRDFDAKAGALNQHSSMLDTLQPPQRQWNGAHPMPGRAAVDELYTSRNGWTFTSFVDRVLAQRADRIRAHHVEELRAQSHKEVSAAEQQARDAAAAGG